MTVNDDPATVTSSTPSTFVAFVLSLLCPGFGHLYVGRVGRGLFLFLSLLLFAPAVAVLLLLKPATPILIALMGLAAFVVLLQIFAIVDAVRVAWMDRHHTRTPLHPAVFVLFILVGLAYPGGTVWLLRTTVVQAYEFQMGSMEPNFLDGDRILANKLSRNLGQNPKRGDIVVFRSPLNRRQPWVKRVIALEGDTVEWVKGRLWVNGKALSLDPIPPSELASTHTGEDLFGFVEENAGRRYSVLQCTTAPSLEPMTVPVGSCYVVGDHRPRSRDSRDFGVIPLGDVIGQVEYVVLPADSWQRFGVCDQS